MSKDACTISKDSRLGHAPIETEISAGDHGSSEAIRHAQDTSKNVRHIKNRTKAPKSNFKKFKHLALELIFGGSGGGSVGNDSTIKNQHEIAAKQARRQLSRPDRWEANRLDALKIENNIDKRDAQVIASSASPFENEERYTPKDNGSDNDMSGESPSDYMDGVYEIALPVYDRYSGWNETHKRDEATERRAAQQKIDAEERQAAQEKRDETERKLAAAHAKVAEAQALDEAAADAPRAVMPPAPAIAPPAPLPTTCHMPPPLATPIDAPAMLWRLRPFAVGEGMKPSDIEAGGLLGGMEPQASTSKHPPDAATPSDLVARPDTLETKPEQVPSRESGYSSGGYSPSTPAVPAQPFSCPPSPQGKAAVALPTAPAAAAEASALDESNAAQMLLREAMETMTSHRIKHLFSGHAVQSSSNRREGVAPDFSGCHALIGDIPDDWETKNTLSFYRKNMPAHKDDLNHEKVRDTEMTVFLDPNRPCGLNTIVNTSASGFGLRPIEEAINYEYAQRNGELAPGRLTPSAVTIHGERSRQKGKPYSADLFYENSAKIQEAPHIKESTMFGVNTLLGAAERVAQLAQHEAYQTVRQLNEKKESAAATATRDRTNAGIVDRNILIERKARFEAGLVKGELKTAPVPESNADYKLQLDAMITKVEAGNYPAKFHAKIKNAETPAPLKTRPFELDYGYDLPSGEKITNRYYQAPGSAPGIGTLTSTYPTGSGLPGFSAAASSGKTKTTNLKLLQDKLHRFDTQQAPTRSLSAPSLEHGRVADTELRPTFPNNRKSSLDHDV